MEGLPETHKDSASSVDLPYSLMSHLVKAPPKNCKKKFTSLTVAMKTVITDCKSGIEVCYIIVQILKMEVH